MRFQSTLSTKGNLLFTNSPQKNFGQAGRMLLVRCFCKTLKPLQGCNSHSLLRCSALCDSCSVVHHVSSVLFFPAEVLTTHMKRFIAHETRDYVFDMKVACVVFVWTDESFLLWSLFLPSPLLFHSPWTTSQDQLHLSWDTLFLG